jgi:hypothetical protein
MENARCSSSSIVATSSDDAISYATGEHDVRFAITPFPGTDNFEIRLHSDV